MTKEESAEEIAARARALIQRARGHLGTMKKLSADQAEDFRRLKRENPLNGVMSQIIGRDREEVQATDQFADEVRREDKLLAEQEARWAEEDRTGARK